MSLTLRTVSPAAPEAPAAPAALPLTATEVINNARKKAKKGRSWLGYVTKKVYGQNNTLTKKRVLNSLSNNHKAKYVEDQLVKSNYNFWTKFGNSAELQKLTVGQRLKYAEKARDLGASRAAQTIGAMGVNMALGVVAGSSAIAVIGASGGLALAGLGTVAVVFAFCAERVARFSAIVGLFNTISLECKRMAQVIKIIQTKGWNIDYTVFNESIVSLITYICSLTTQDEMQGAVNFGKDANKKFQIKTNGRFYGLIGRTLRYLNPTEIGMVLSERTGRVTSAFSVIVGEYVLLSADEKLMTINNQPIIKVATNEQIIIQPSEILSLAIGGLDKGADNPTLQKQLNEDQKQAAAETAATATAEVAAANLNGDTGGTGRQSGGRTRRRR